MPELNKLNRLGDLLMGFAHCVRHVVGKGGPVLPADRLELEARSTYMLEQLERVGLIGNWETIAEWRGVARSSGRNVSQAELADAIDSGRIGPLPPQINLVRLDLVEQWIAAGGPPESSQPSAQ